MVSCASGGQVFTMVQNPGGKANRKHTLPLIKQSSRHFSGMMAQTSRISCLLFLMGATVVLSLFSWEYLSEGISRMSFQRHNHTWSDTGTEIWDMAENSSTPPTTAQKAKIADSTTATPVSRLKTEQTGASTRGAVAETPMPVLSIQSFNKLPEWDFEDVYNQDAPPRQTTCSQSLRQSKDESFRKAFLPNIRLFLHKDNINMSEWNRLSHFNNPFGFMDYKYQDVMAAVKLIPKPQEPLLQPKPGSGGCVRCAVVGTAGILNGSKMGKEIDAHDYVFRMNGAVIKGHEEDVGNRTSVYVHTAHTITTSKWLFKKYGYTSAPNDEGIKYVIIPEGMRDFNWLEGLLKGERVPSGPYQNHRPWTYYGGQYNETHFYVLHQDFLRYVRNRFLKSDSLNTSYWSIVRPTNGAFTLFLALHTCDTVSAYGFMTEDFDKYSNYYFERVKTNVVFYGNHDYTLEKNLWKHLHDSKIMKLYQRTDTEPRTEKPTKH